MKWRDQSEFSLFSLSRKILGLGSPPAVADALELAGLWLGRVLRWRRRVVRDNLAGAFPGLSSDEIDSRIDLVFRHLGRTAGEFLVPDLERRLCEVEVVPGWEVLDQALACGRGAIIATGHIGNFELGGAVLARRYQLLDVVKKQRNPLFDAELARIRAGRGIATVEMDRSLSRILRQLQGGGLVSLLLDQDAGKTGVPVKWFGRRASTWPGAARLAIRTGCPVVPMGLLRLPDHRHRLHVGAPLWPDRLTDDPQDVKMFLQIISDAVADILDHDPHQWFWVHRRWKSHPQPAESSVNPT